MQSAGMSCEGISGEKQGLAEGRFTAQPRASFNRIQAHLPREVSAKSALIETKSMGISRAPRAQVQTGHGLQICPDLPRVMRPNEQASGRFAPVGSQGRFDGWIGILRGPVTTPVTTPSPPVTPPPLPLGVTGGRQIGPPGDTSRVDTSCEVWRVAPGCRGNSSSSRIIAALERRVFSRGLVRWDAESTALTCVRAEVLVLATATFACCTG